MKAVLLISFLSFLTIVDSGCKTSSGISNKSDDCSNKRFKDSLMHRYVDSGAFKLPYIYNNPAWSSYLDSVLAICPDNADAYELKAVPAIKNGDYLKAYQLDERAAELDPQQYLPYVGFLKCIFTKDYEGAIADFTRANSIIPGGAEMDHSFYFYLGLCYLELGKFRQAESNFNSDIFFQNKGSGNAEVHFNSLMYMGITKFEKNELDSAEIYLNKSLRIYPELPEANYYLALVYKNRNDDAREKKYLEIAQKSLLAGYSMNEDNLYYINYPHQITLFEVGQQFTNLHL